jgi:anti-anti-sigma factor
LSAPWIGPHPKVSRFVVHRCDDEVVLALSGEIDIASMNELERQLDAVAFSLPAKVVVDFAELEFIDGRGAAAVAAMADALPAFGTAVVLRSPRAAVRRVFDLVGVGSLTIEP